MKKHWPLISSLEFLGVGTAIRIGVHNQGPWVTLAEAMIVIGTVLFFYWWLFICISPAFSSGSAPPSTKPKISRELDWEIHGGLECETCNLFYRDDAPTKPPGSLSTPLVYDLTSAGPSFCVSYGDPSISVRHPLVTSDHLRTEVAWFMDKQYKKTVNRVNTDR